MKNNNWIVERFGFRFDLVQIFYLLSLQLLVLSQRELAFALACLVIISSFRPLVSFIKANCWLMSLIPQFLLSRVVSESPLRTIYLKVAVATLAFYFATGVVSLRRKNINFVNLVVSTILVMFLCSLILTAIYMPSLLVQRQIFEFPYINFREWGTTFIYYCLPVIALSAISLYRKKYWLFFLTQIVVFFAIYWGVRGALLALAVSYIAVFFANGSWRRKIVISGVNIALVVVFSLFSKWIESHLVSRESVNIRNPSIMRNWESPRVTLLRDISKSRFWVNNIWGGQHTAFTHFDFSENPHNMLIQTYWTSGIFAFVLLCVIWVLIFIKSETIEQKTVTLGFFISFCMNIYTTWFFIVFVVYCTFIFFQKDKIERFSMPPKREEV